MLALVAQYSPQFIYRLQPVAHGIGEHAGEHWWTRFEPIQFIISSNNAPPPPPDKMAAIWQKAFSFADTWTNDDPVDWRIYAAPGGD